MSIYRLVFVPGFVRQNKDNWSRSIPPELTGIHHRCRSPACNIYHVDIGLLYPCHSYLIYKTVACIRPRTKRNYLLDFVSALVYFFGNISQPKSWCFPHSIKRIVSSFHIVLEELHYTRLRNLINIVKFHRLQCLYLDTWMVRTCRLNI
jgi:hypothetical protein